MKVLRTLFSLLVGMAIVASLALIPVSGANNYKDSTFSFEISGMEKKKTAYRQKRDDSSSYMKCNYVSNPSRPYYGRVWAYYELGSNGNLTGVLEKDASDGHVYTFFQGQSGKKMINYVWEWKPSNTLPGRAYAAIEVSVGWYDSLTISGLWSPDSI